MPVVKQQDEHAPNTRMKKKAQETQLKVTRRMTQTKRDLCTDLGTNQLATEVDDVGLRINDTDSHDVVASSQGLRAGKHSAAKSFKCTRNHIKQINKDSEINVITTSI